MLLPHLLREMVASIVGRQIALGPRLFYSRIGQKKNPPPAATGSLFLSHLLEFPEFIDLIMLKYLFMHNKTDTTTGRNRFRERALPEPLGYPLTGGRSGARMAHAEDCLSEKPDDERASEFRRQVEGAFSKGERQSIERATGTVEPG